MKLIVGLGNPGKQYENTRHNVGHIMVDALKKWRGVSGEWKVVKTSVFMNSSGEEVRKLITDYRGASAPGLLSATDLYVVHDDLDIPLGKFKIQFGKGPKDHKGVQSVEKELGTSGFWRIRVGVENRDQENRISGEEYTLQEFLPEEREIINRVIEEIKEKLENGSIH